MSAWRPPPSPDSPLWPPGPIEEAESVFWRAGNRLTYVRQDGDELWWSIDVLVRRGDKFVRPRDAPRAQQRRLPAGAWADDVLRTRGPVVGLADFILPLLVFRGFQLRAAPGREQELATLLRTAENPLATELSNAALRYTPETRALLDRLADVIERTGCATAAQLPGRPEVFAPDRITFLSDPYTQAGVRAMWAADEWVITPGAFPYYNDRPTRVQVYLAPGGAGSPATVDALQDARNRVLDLDDRQVSTYLICLGKWAADTGCEPTRPARVHVDDILGFRGIKKHLHGGYRPDQKAEVREDVLLLRDIWVRSDQEVWEDDAQGRRRRQSVHVDSPLLHVEIESVTDIFSGEDIPYAFRVWPGSYATHYVGDKSPWITRLLRPVMQYHPYHDRLPMRIGIYLAFQWRIRAHYGNFDQPWRMATLLEGAKIVVPDRNFARFQSQVAKALEQLKRDGLLATAESVDPMPQNAAPLAGRRAWLDVRWHLLPPPGLLPGPATVDARAEPTHD
jgi:hypothetical protein